MASDGNDDTMNERHLDVRALRFALVFPLLLALALAFGGFLLRDGLPDGVVLPLGGSAVPLPAFLAVGAGAILLLGAGVGGFGARTTLPRTLRRVLLGLGMTLQLSTFTVFAAALLGQGASGGLPPERVDGFVVLMGCGLAVAMGVVLALTFKPEEQWTLADDAALANMLADESSPAGANDNLGYFLHPRSSVIIMILLLAVLPGSLLALISPWILLALAAAALALIAALCATVQVDGRQLTVKLCGIAPVLVVPRRSVDGAVSLDIAAKDHGGWGLRKHSGSASFLSYSGAAVVLRQSDGGTVVISAPNLDIADEVSEILNRGTPR